MYSLVMSFNVLVKIDSHHCLDSKFIVDFFLPDHDFVILSETQFNIVLGYKKGLK